MKKSRKILFFVNSFYLLLFCELNALTLKDSVVEVLKTNPIISERLKNYRATQQDLNIAESEYYPKLDFRAVAAYNTAGEIKDYADDSEYHHNVIDEEYRNYETSLTLTQNIFDGFGTMHKIDYQEARILAAAYNYLEKANDTAFKMVGAYIDLLRSHELTQIAVENVQINNDIYKKVKQLYKAGLTTESEVKKIESALLLAESNLIVQKNNTQDSEYTFKKVLGRMPEINNMQRPDFNIAMPESIERAAIYSVEHNPSLLVSRYNIKGAQALYEQRKKEYYPKVDFEASQFYNDVEKRNSFDSPDDRFRARLVLTYNLFRGGEDKANVQKHLSIINQEIAIKRDLKRQVIEGLELSWNAYEMIGRQLETLRKYSQYSKKTLELYKDEYDLGRRSLLDLLSSQNDLINAKTQIVTADYERLFAKYRILDAMGLLVVAVAGDVDAKELTSKVNLYTYAEAHEILDTAPVKLDADNDTIRDSIDLCDNSLVGDNIMPSGCKKLVRDNDADGVSDILDSCPATPKGVRVTQNGCAVDMDNDGVKDYADECLNTPIGIEIDAKGCGVDKDMDGVKDYKDKCLNTKIGEKVDARGCMTLLKTEKLIGNAIDKDGEK